MSAPWRHALSLVLVLPLALGVGVWLGYVLGVALGGS